MIELSKQSLWAAAAAVLCASFMTSAYASEPTVAGVWQQIDPGSGFVGGLISFKEKNGLWEGYIVKMYPKPGDPVDPVCAGCTDDRKDQPVLGIRLIQNAKRDGLSYEGGSILDPRNGSQYSVELTLAPDNETLTVRGYLGDNAPRPEPDMEAAARNGPRVSKAEPSAGSPRNAGKKGSFRAETGSRTGRWLVARPGLPR